MTTKSTTKRTYEKPQMRMYEVKHRSMILCGSSSSYPNGINSMDDPEDI